MASYLSLQNVAKSYGGVPALHSLSLDVEPGEVLGLLGPNGAGKTTTIHLLVQLFPPDSGSITIQGKALGPDAKARLGFVPQELALYEDLRVVENLDFFAALYGMKGRALREARQRVLQFVGLSGKEQALVRTFSGGMKRRLNLAIGLLHNPDLLLLDEPTVGVDPQTRQFIYDQILALKKEGKTILYTTQYMEEAERLCDRVAILDRGRLIAWGTLNELLSITGHRYMIRIEADTPSVSSLLDPFQRHPSPAHHVVDPTSFPTSELPNSSTPRFPDSPTSGLSVPCSPTADGRQPTVDSLTSFPGNTCFFIETSEPEEALHILLSTVREKGIRLKSLECLRPSLENVFLHLTGKTLRD